MNKLNYVLVALAIFSLLLVLTVSLTTVKVNESLEPELPQELQWQPSERQPKLAR